jgi:thiamine monophosphate synthase
MIAYSNNRGRWLQRINGINIAINKNYIGIGTFFFTTTKESEKKYKNRKIN